MHEPQQRKSFLDRLASTAKPDLIIANSQFTRHSLNLLYPGIRKEVLYNPVHFQKPNNADSVRQQVRASFGVSDDTSVIIQAGRPADIKGYDLAIEALGNLGKTADFKFWIVANINSQAEADYVGSLRNKVKVRGLNQKVNFILDQQYSLNELLLGADIYCQPNRGPEGFGNMFVEAMSAHLPVITTGIGAALEIVTKKCGILLPQIGGEPLTNALSKLISDHRFRKEMGSYAKIRSGEFTNINSTINKINTLFTSLGRP